MVGQMPTNVFGNSSLSRGNGIEIDTSFFVRKVQKPYLRTNYIESNIEENTDLKNQNRIKNLHCCIQNSDAVCISYVDG